MTAAERQRLARILGMLGSEFEGERRHSTHTELSKCTF